MGIAVIVAVHWPEYGLDCHRHKTFKYSAVLPLPYMPFCCVKEAILDIQLGRFIIVLDDRENERERGRPDDGRGKGDA